MIGGGRVELCLHCMIQARYWRTGITFHLIINNPFKNQRRRRISRRLELNTMAFLGKIEGIKPRKKYCIQVDLHQIEVILAVLAGKWIGRIVTGRESVHKCVKGTADHRKERVPDRKFFATAKRCMFQYVRDASRITRHGPERNHEDVLVAVICQVEMPGA